MSVATFTIQAIDKTRAAFASVNQGLNNLVKGGDAGQKKMVGLGLRMVGLSSIAMVLGMQVRKIAQDIESVPGVSRDTIDSWDQLKARMATVQGVLGNIVASAGQGINSLVNLIRFGWIAALDGVDAAQADVLANERALAETARLNSGYYDKLITAQEKLSKARRDFKNIGETDAQSIVRRRQEADTMERSALAITDQVKRTEELAKVVEFRTAAEKDFQKLLAETNKLTNDAGIANGRMIGSTMKLGERIAALETEWVGLSAELATFNDLTDPASLEKRAEVLKRMTVAANGLTKAYDEQNRIAADAALIMTRGFEDAIFAGEGLRGTIRGIGQDLMRHIFQQMITIPITGWLTGGIAKLKGSAAGGPISAGATHIVGENGPELFTPSQAGRIIPNHDLGGTGGGGGTQFFIDARNADKSGLETLAAAIRDINGSIEPRAVAAVFDKMRRQPRGAFA